ncbi:MAG: succinate dehydrogenase cytochrome b subunit [Verrucomicrobiales bacterium]|nr:succinate dehydrogenase cytochrome b subunit [Verrucomicrobiales bacterium]
MNPLGKAILQFCRSTIGRKLIVALTGVLLVLFLLGHVAGNLLVFQGREAMNDYAQFLHTMLHGQGVWIARIGLLIAVGLHIWATVSLVKDNRAARTERYALPATVQASKSSRIMIWSGLTILAFVVFHILHFTVRIDPALANLPDAAYAAAHPGESRHDVYAMVIKGFQNPLVSLFYIVAITLLCSHLSHGIASLFQTLGWRSRKSAALEKQLGWAIAIALWIGFLSIPAAVLTGALKDKPSVSGQKAAIPSDPAAPAPRQG